MLSIGGHPSPEAPANWHLVKVGMGPGKEFTVVCGGEGYKVGDIVAYTPVGQTVKGGQFFKILLSFLWGRNSLDVAWLQASRSSPKT